MCADNPRVVLQRLSTFSAPIDGSVRITRHSETAGIWLHAPPKSPWRNLCGPFPTRGGRVGSGRGDTALAA
jgi:hypothetical protein